MIFKRNITSFFLALLFFVFGTTQAKNNEFSWLGGQKLAVSLSYDDALNSQLDHAIPELDKYNLKASFYVTPNSPVMNTRMDEWRTAAKNGHELGNHSIYHPCRASLPNRKWVPKHHDLDNYSVAQMVEELTTANTFLQAIDGKTERTYTIPCGDLLVGGEEYLSKVNHLFTAIKGFGADKRLSLIWDPTDSTGKELIDYIKNISSDILLVNIIFHGVGGDYLSVSSEAHAELLRFLANNRDSYYVDSYINLMKYAGNIQQNLEKPQDNSVRIISRTAYKNSLYGFWLGQSIANWTGLVTEMDKIGGDGPQGEFYTRDDWGKTDQPSIWGQGIPSDLSENIDFVFEDEAGIWGSDDDTDIEYMYQYLLYTNKTTILTPEQIRDGWLKHIYSDENTPFTAEGNPENYLWVSNQRAHDLMANEGLLPPATSHPDNNKEYEMIDAQLTTEIFGFFAPSRPDVALKMAYLPIRTTARENAAWASEFYVIMYSLASSVDKSLPMKDQIQWMANIARQRLPNDSYSAKMFDFVQSRHQADDKWEAVRDALYQKYQVNQEDGYDITSRNRYCNGCFASGINFAASIVSLLYGEGDIIETIKIAALSGWDSDNPAATWGGLLGFMIGKSGVEEAFDRKFSNKFNIHRTRGNFPNNGLDDFSNMAEQGIAIIDRVVVEQMGGEIVQENDTWIIPKLNNAIIPSSD